MSKFYSKTNKDNILNSRVKSQLDEKKIKKIRNTLFSLTEMEMRASNLYNITIIKKEENDNQMVMQNIIPQRIYHEDFELNQTENKIENELKYYDSKELVDSSDIESEDDDF